MKFIKLSTKYMLKNFLYLGLLGVIPAVFFGTLLSPFKVLEFINTYSQNPVLNFGSIFYGVLDVGTLNLLLLFIAFFLIAIFVSAILGIMENHMRSGKHNFENLKEYVNNNILMVIANLIALLLLAFVIMFVASAVLYLLHLVFSGINTSPTVFNAVLANIILSAILVLYALIASVILVNVPNMIINGSEFRYSLSRSIKLLQQNTLAMVISVVTPFLIIAGFVSIFIGTEGFVFVNIIGVFMLIMYFASLAMTSYFELTKTARYDNRKKYYYK
jgi:hypothetical protein